MRFFTALAQVQNFSAAAELCHVTQPTLSAAIKEMEALLNLTLFERSKKGAQLTAQGQDLLPEIEAILDQSKALTERAQQMSKPMSGPFRLGVIPTIAPYYLPKVLPAIKAEFPALELHIHEDMSHRIYADMKAGKLDMILLAFPYDIENEAKINIMHENFVLAHPVNKPIINPYIRVSDINPEELLLLSDGHCMRDHVINSCHIDAVKTQQNYSASSLTMLVQMVAAGYGYTLLPQMMLDTTPLPEGVALHEFHFLAPTRSIGVAGA